MLIFGGISCKKNQVTKNETAALEQSAVSNEAAVAGYKKFIIKKGAHYSSPNPYVLTGKSQLVFNAVFDSSCIYTTKQAINQQDVNKLYGFSDCNSQHLVNSARIGWFWYEGALHLSAYVHNNGEILIQEITTIPIGKVNKCRISCLAAVYEFEVNGIKVSLPRNCSGAYTRYKLNPYFGGDEVAPHLINIWINEL